ncbi:hypothetical protein LX16_4238 [Stackebrandtia albiflava]|uniref:Uncharacterized protein n=1 Tax=Stackebrandtia albiflava TaxID=406432 RepID=A0A562UYU3_9ACTN|nr:hypothetical protein [Stackebrandtia albiflava]TWJ10814.1 hypothetical protein LX16_4238 [Stackebrandtia albiflava]
MKRINRIADKALSKLVGKSTAKASCVPYWEYYCSFNPAVCTGGHARYRRYITVDCTACCTQHVGCC